jgi:hypothetical protein
MPVTTSRGLMRKMICVQGLLAVSTSTNSNKSMCLSRTMELDASKTSQTSCSTRSRTFSRLFSNEIDDLVVVPENLFCLTAKVSLAVEADNPGRRRFGF